MSKEKLSYDKSDFSSGSWEIYIFISFVLDNTINTKTNCILCRIKQSLTNDFMDLSWYDLLCFDVASP